MRKLSILCLLFCSLSIFGQTEQEKAKMVNTLPQMDFAEVLDGTLELSDLGVISTHADALYRLPITEDMGFQSMQEAKDHFNEVINPEDLNPDFTFIFETYKDNSGNYLVFPLRAFYYSHPERVSWTLEEWNQFFSDNYQF